MGRAGFFYVCLTFESCLVLLLFVWLPLLILPPLSPCWPFSLFSTFHFPLLACIFCYSSIVAATISSLANAPVLSFSAFLVSPLFSLQTDPPG